MEKIYGIFLRIYKRGMKDEFISGTIKKNISGEKRSGRIWKIYFITFSFIKSYSNFL